MHTVSVLFQSFFSHVQSCSVLGQSCSVLSVSPVSDLFQPHFLSKFTNLELASLRVPLGKLIMTSRGALISARPSLLDVFRSSTIKIFFCKGKKTVVSDVVHSDTRTAPSPPRTAGVCVWGGGGGGA